MKEKYLAWLDNVVELKNREKELKSEISQLIPCTSEYEYDSATLCTQDWIQLAGEFDFYQFAETCGFEVVEKAFSTGDIELSFEYKGYTVIALREENNASISD